MRLTRVCHGWLVQPCVCVGREPENTACEQAVAQFCDEANDR